MNKEPQSVLDQNLRYLRLFFMQDNYQELAEQAAKKHYSHVDYFEKLVEGEAAMLRDRSIRSTYPSGTLSGSSKTLDQFTWSWPKSINRLQVQNLFRLTFIKEKSNVIFLGGVRYRENPSGLCLGLRRLSQGDTLSCLPQLLMSLTPLPLTQGRWKDEARAKIIHPSGTSYP